jgi:hypothetical protein
MDVAIANCQKHSSDPCRLYAVNGNVVWANENATTAQNDARDEGHAVADNSGSGASNAVDTAHSLASR